MVDGVTRPVPVVPPPGRGDPARLATGGGDRVAHRQHRHQRRGDVSLDVPSSAARQRLLGSLSTALQRPVAVALARGHFGTVLLGPPSAARHHRERPARSKPQLQGNDPGRAGDPNPWRRAARGRCSCCRPRRRRASRRPAPHCRRACATPGATCWSSTSVRRCSSRAWRSRCADATKTSRPEYASKRQRIGQTWQESWVGWTGGMAVEATLADPQLAPMRIPLAGVKARYVRVYPASAWMKAELVVQGQ